MDLEVSVLLQDYNLWTTFGDASDVESLVALYLTRYGILTVSGIHMLPTLAHFYLVNSL